MTEECAVCREKSSKTLQVHVCKTHYEQGATLLYDMIHTLRRRESEIEQEEEENIKK